MIYNQSYQLSEMDKVGFRTRFETLIKNLLDIEKYLGMFLAATRDVAATREIVDLVSYALLMYQE